jgi:hypothetical protein
MTRGVVLILCCLLAGIPSSVVAGRDVFLTIGGGPVPTNNQISLEKNVLMLQTLLLEQYPGGTPHEIFFADGKNGTRGLIFRDASKEIPEVNQLLAKVLRQERYLTLGYRSHEIPNVAGASNRETITNWFEQQGSRLEAGDRLFVYVTAHGGKSTDKDAPENTKLYLWNNQSYEQSEMTELFNKVPPEVPVVLVMVQCYSGGFADTVLAKSGEGKQLVPHNRCGFFATVQTRPAAGCTPDIDEENYEEYSSYFWAALRGKRRTGEPIAPPDYDGDGTVCFEEAHAYAVLHSSTIDIPVKTSDAALRELSRLGGEDDPELFTADSPFDELFELASPAEQAILSGLSDQLELNESSRSSEAEKLAKQFDDRRRKVDSDRRKSNGKRNAILGSVANRLKLRWPELNNRWDPQVSELLTNESAELLREIKEHPRYGELLELEREIDRADGKSLELEKQWCRCQRLIRTLENIALRVNMSRIASAEQQSAFERLLLAERGTLAPGGADPPSVSQSRDP